MSTKQLLITRECVRCGLPFGVTPADLDSSRELLCIGCHGVWADAGYPDELPPPGDHWEAVRPVAPVPATRPMRRRRGDAQRRSTDPAGYRP